MTWGWCFAGIHQELSSIPDPCLEVRRARARAIVALSACEQLSIDEGQWVMASELLLEDEPPVAAFKGHGSGESLSPAPFSGLIDHRRQAVHMNRLRTLDELIERRRRLGKGPGRRPAAEPTGRPEGAVAEAADGGGKTGKKGKRKEE